MGGLDLECVITFEGKCPIDHCGEAIYFIKEQLEAKTTVHCRQCGNNVNAESILSSIETKVRGSSNQDGVCYHLGNFSVINVDLDILGKSTHYRRSYFSVKVN